MTEKQRRFADYYIKTGNAAEAARLAGYKARNARSIGAENLTKPEISQYIKDRIEDLSDVRIADAREVMEMFSNILRGDIEGISAHDRIEAGRAILRRLERLEDRQTSEVLLTAAQELLGEISSVIN